MPAQVIVDRQGVARYVHYGHDMSDIPSNEELLAVLDALNAPSRATRQISRVGRRGRGVQPRWSALRRTGGIGSTRSLPRRISKWRWGPVEKPVLPMEPTTAPSVRTP